MRKKSGAQVRYFECFFYRKCRVSSFQTFFVGCCISGKIHLYRDLTLQEKFLHKKKFSPVGFENVVLKKNVGLKKPRVVYTKRFNLWPTLVVPHASPPPSAMRNPFCRESRERGWLLPHRWRLADRGLSPVGSAGIAIAVFRWPVQVVRRGWRKVRGGRIPLQTTRGGPNLTFSINRVAPAPRPSTPPCSPVFLHPSAKPPIVEVGLVTRKSPRRMIFGLLMGWTLHPDEKHGLTGLSVWSGEVIGGERRISFYPPPCNSFQCPPPGGRGRCWPPT